MKPAPHRSHRLLELFLPGLLLGAGGTALAVIAAFVDSARSGRRHGVADLLTPDPIAAAWTMSLVGTAEGVAIAIVIVVVVLGVQLTADRYSPRIIDIFVRDRMNAGVLSLFLGSIVVSIWVSTEIKPDYVPYAGIYLATGLAIVDFSVLLPYVRYMFQVMRGETIVLGIRRHAAAAIAHAARSQAHQASHRPIVREALAQLGDIALGSVQEGDTEVALVALQALRGLVCEDYIALKPKLNRDWFTVTHLDMPGASDQTITQVDRSHTWLEHRVLATFIDLVGETPAFRKEVIHAIASATRDVGRQAVTHGDAELEDLVVRFFNTYFRAALNQRAPTFAYSVMNEYRRFAADIAPTRPGVTMRIAEHLLRYGRAFDAAGMPFIIGTAAEDVADLVVEMAALDPDRAMLLVHLLVRTLDDMSGVAQPVALNGVLKAAVKLALWAIAEDQPLVLKAVATGLRRVDASMLDRALGRMETTTERVFWEVSDRVVAYDWVEDATRELISVLRHTLAAEAAPEPSTAPIH